MTGPVIASVSGGKDSTALCLWLQEQGIPYRAVHMDTGWEHPLTDAYIREVLEPRIGPIEWIAPERKMVELIRHKGMFPSRMRRFCTEHLKTKPYQRWLAAQYPTGEVVTAVGIRAEESQARAAMPEREATYIGEIWRPLLSWPVESVVEIHKRHSVAPNPLYLKPGIERVGCWPCIFARKAEIRTIAEIDPGHMDMIEALESEITALANEKIRARGDEPTHPQTFFSSKHGHKGIRDVVEWSRTQRGGRHRELFYDPDRSGCVRWGLCDA